jgi:hypothetical protein
MNLRRIELEVIPYLRFTKSDVLSEKDERKEREHQLASATALTKSDHEEIGIVVKLENGDTVEVVSNLIELGGDYVELHGGFIIPLRSIVRITL